MYVYSIQYCNFVIIFIRLIGKNYFLVVPEIKPIVNIISSIMTTFKTFNPTLTFSTFNECPICFENVHESVEYFLNAEHNGKLKQ